MQTLRTVVVLAFLAVTSLTAAQTLQQVPPPAPQRPADEADPSKQPAAAIVRGHVFGADTSQPLRKAQVRLFPTDVANGGSTETRQATTDANGAYEFKELPAGKYLVNASKGGYVGMSVGQARPNEPGKPITLLASELRERVDFTLLRGGVITGRVVDEYGEPMSRIQVSAMRSETTGGRKQLMPGRTALTDDLGEFRIFGISPGPYYVQATWRGMMPVLAPGAPADEETGYATTFFPGTSAASEAQRLTVVSGQTISDIAFAMVPAKTARVSGTVVDSHGQPGQGMLMISRHESATIESGMNMMVTIRPDGTFAFANLTTGDYTLHARLNGPKPENAAVNVSVAGVDITDVALTTVPASSAIGRIVADATASQSMASATLSVIALPAEPNGFDFPGRTPARVADDLTFKLDVPAGLMQIQAIGLPSGFGVRAVRLGGVDVTDSGVEFKSGRDVNGLEIEVTNRLTTVSGLVSDARGDSVKDYSVVVFPQDTNRWTTRSRYMRVARPDEDGRFKVSGLPLGEYYAIALDRIDNVKWNDAEFLQSVQPQATMFSLLEAETKTMDLRLRTAPR